MNLAPPDELFTGRLAALLLLAQRGDWRLVRALLAHCDPTLATELRSALAEAGHHDPDEPALTPTHDPGRPADVHTRTDERSR